MKTLFPYPSTTFFKEVKQDITYKLINKKTNYQELIMNLDEDDELTNIYEEIPNILTKLKTKNQLTVPNKYHLSISNLYKIMSGLKFFKYKLHKKIFNNRFLLQSMIYYLLIIYHFNLIFYKSNKKFSLLLKKHMNFNILKKTKKNFLNILRHENLFYMSENNYIKKLNEKILLNKKFNIFFYNIYFLFNILNNFKKSNTISPLIPFHNRNQHLYVSDSTKTSFVIKKKWEINSITLLNEWKKIFNQQYKNNCILINKDELFIKNVINSSLVFLKINFIYRQYFFSKQLKLFLNNYKFGKPIISRKRLQLFKKKLLFYNRLIFFASKNKLKKKKKNNY